MQNNGKHTAYVLKAIAKDSRTGEKMAVYFDEHQNQLLVEPWSFYQQRLTSSPAIKMASEYSTDQKLKIYRERFHGRTDVYAKRYFNKKVQRDVYSPATTFTDGRPNRDDPLPLTDTVLKDHLKGKVFIGIYPLLKNETVNFLVIDIDKKNWQEIVHALIKVSKQAELNCAIEKSQSGNGAHIWYFFSEPITAKLARQLGQAILKSAMMLNADISFDAFDRLFPNQDTMPEGGYGNLIAAPLQYERMKQGCSIFVDEQFKPFSNQWEFLANLATLTADVVQMAVTKLERKNSAHLFEVPAKDQINLLSDKMLAIKKPIKMYRRNQLYIAKSQLSANEINTLRWLATFANPEFFKRQKQRFSTWDTPRYISLAEQDEKYLILPRGNEEVLKQSITQLEVVDETEKGQPIHVQFEGELRAEQQQAQAALLQQNIGILAARTGFGKTIVAASLIAKRAVSTLVLVNNRALVEQWQQQLTKFLTITDEPFVEYTKTGRKKKKSVIGTYYANHKRPSHLVDVATVQTISRLEDIPAFMANYGMIIVDEVHHLAALTFDETIKQSAAKYIYGLSATPYRRDGWDPIIFMRAGQIAYQTAKMDEKQLLTTKRIVTLRVTSLGILNNEEMVTNSIQDNYEAIVNDSDRNQMIVEDIIKGFKAGRHQLVLTRRLEQLDNLKTKLPADMALPIFELSGRGKAKDNRVTIEKISKLSSPYLILATSNYIGEGFDVPTIDTILLAMPISWKGSLEQYLGRMNRSLSQKNELQVYDYVDLFIPMLARMYQKRLKTYRELKYQLMSNERDEVVQVYQNETGKAVLNKELAAKSATIVIGIVDLNWTVWNFVKQLDKDHVELVITKQAESGSLDVFNALRESKFHFSTQAQVLNVLIINRQVVWQDYQQLLFKQSQGSALYFNSQPLAEKLLNVLEDNQPKLF